MARAVTIPPPVSPLAVDRHLLAHPPAPALPPHLALVVTAPAAPARQAAPMMRKSRPFPWTASASTPSSAAILSSSTP